MQKLSATLVVSMLLLASSQAGNVGRQRRVHTSATSTSTGASAAQLAGLGLPLWHATFASNDEYIETPFKRVEAIAPRSHQQQEPQLAENSARSAQGLDLFDLLPAAEVTPAQLQQLLLGAPAATANPGQMRLLGAGNEQAGEGRFLGKTFVFVLPVGGGNNSAGGENKTVIINTTNTNIQNSTEPASSSTTTGTTTRFVPIDSLRTQGLPLQYFQTRQGQDAGANLMALNAGASLQLPYNVMDFNQAALGAGGYTGGYAGGYTGGYAGGAVPLVPVTLGNNAVGYVPLNLRMFRQLIDGAAQPIRESEDDVVTASGAALPVEAIVEPELESEPEISGDAAPAAQKAAGSRFQLFAQRLRQRPVVSVAPAVAAATSSNVPTEYAIRNSFLPFRNLRRVQYV